MHDYDDEEPVTPKAFLIVMWLALAVFAGILVYAILH